jgi:hypothetical protein
MRGRLGGNRKGYVDYECEWKKKRKGKVKSYKLKVGRNRSGRGGGDEPSLLLLQYENSPVSRNVETALK